MNVVNVVLSFFKKKATEMYSMSIVSCWVYTRGAGRANEDQQQEEQAFFNSVGYICATHKECKFVMKL